MWSKHVLRIAVAILGSALGPARVARAADPITGLQYSIAADVVGKLGAKHMPNPPADRDRLFAREAELVFYGPIDHKFDGLVSAAAHFETGQNFFEIHEAYVGSTKFLPRSRFKLGQYFLGVGRLNHVHRHDWPFTSAPRVHETFFASEAAIDSGLEYGYLPPLPFYLDLNVGVTSGHTFGHTHTAGKRPLTPTHYARLATYADLWDQAGMEIGLNYLGRKSDARLESRLYGFDFLAKAREGKTVRWLLQHESWLRHERNAARVLEKKLGTYTFPQYGFSPEFLFGVRFDSFSHLNKTNALTQQREKNVYWTVVPTATYKPSEFSTFRLSYSNTVYRELSETLSTDHLIELQATFILGAHPAHEF